MDYRCDRRAGVQKKSLPYQLTAVVVFVIENGPQGHGVSSPIGIVLMYFFFIADTS